MGQNDDALVIAQRALSLGFGTSVGVIHDGSGQIAPLDSRQRELYRQLQGLGRGFYSHAHDRLFQENLIRGTCAPFCTVSCVHRVALLDAIRERPLEMLESLSAADRAASGQTPRTVKVLTRVFVTSPRRDLFRRLALRALR